MEGTALKIMGRHFLVECFGVDFDKLNDQKLIKKAMIESAEKMKVTILHHYFHQFSPQGVSGAVVIAESHLTIHTWPEEGYAAVDFFTCGDADPYEGFMEFAAQLGIQNLEITEISRGYGMEVQKPSKMKFVFDYPEDFATTKEEAVVLSNEAVG